MTDAATVPPVAGKGDRRRSAILVTARRILVDDGVDQFVLRDVASRVGVTLGNLQYYFATRDDLLEAVVRAEFARNQADVAAITVDTRPPRAKLAAITRHLLDVWARAGGRVYAVMSLLALHQPRFRALHREIYTAFYDGLVPVLRELHPRASRAELLRLARLVTTLIDGALVQLPSRTFVDEAVDAALQLADPASRPATGRRTRSARSSRASRARPRRS